MKRQGAVTVAGGVLTAVPVQRPAVAVAGVVAVAQPKGGEAGIEAVGVVGVDAKQLPVGGLTGVDAGLEDGRQGVGLRITATADQLHGPLDHQSSTERVGVGRNGDGHHRLAALGNGVGLGDRLAQGAHAAALAIATGGVIGAVHRQRQGLRQGSKPQQTGG